MTPFIVMIASLVAYVGVRLLAPFAAPAQVAGVLALGALFWLMPKGWRVREQRGKWAMLAPWIALGFFSWLLVLTVARDVLLLAATVVFPHHDPDVWLPASALGVLLLAPVISFIGFVMARRVAPVVEIDIPFAALPEALEGFTIAQISDLHVGPTIKRDYVERVVASVNRIGADIVAITGDLVDGTVHDLAHHTEPLADLQSRHGTYFVTGNHEYYSGVQQWVHELERLGAHVLMNEHVVIDHRGAKIAIAGITDYSAHYFDPRHESDPQGAARGAPQDALKVLLAHQPRSALNAERAGFDLQLSGHTHGGQFWPWNFFVRLQQPFTAGLKRLGRMWVYVSRGTGYWGPPMRFGIPSEITRIRLVRA